MKFEIFAGQCPSKISKFHLPYFRVVLLNATNYKTKLDEKILNSETKQFGDTVD